MTPAEFRMVREVFEDVLAKSGCEREEVLERIGPADHPVRTRVESLLQAAEMDGAFLQTSLAPADAALRLAESVLLAESDLLVGRRVGRYLVRRLIGSGGMGKVYEAQQEQPQRLVALKVVHPALASRSSLRRFEHEASLLARLRHPGIAQVYEAGAATIELDGRSMVVPFFAMEHLADAAPLTDFARSRGASLAQRLSLLAQVCDAVHHGHQRGVIHRDLKPGNILVEPSGQPRVIDFGIARAADGDAAAPTLPTIDGHVAGTLAYMSPEQLAGDPGELDTRTDIYALGVVLFELLTGKLPFDLTDKQPAEAARIVRDEEPRRLSALVPLLRGDVETIVGKAMAKDRAIRYASAAQLAEDIRRFLGNEPIQARPPSAFYQARLFARRNRGLVAAAGTAAATLAIATAATTGMAMVATREARAAETARQVATSERDRAVRVADFLEGVVASANPRLAARTAETKTTTYDPFAEWRTAPWPYVGRPGFKATVPDLLIAATQRLDETFPDDPATRARLATAMGRTLFCLTDDEVDITPARDALLKAVEAARQAYGDDHETTIRASLFLADALGHTGPIGANWPYLERAVASAERLFGKFDERTQRAQLVAAANVHLWDPDRMKPVLLVEEIIAAADAAGETQRPGVLVLKAYLGQLRWWAGQAARAEPTAREALAELIRVEGQASPYTEEAMGYLAEVLQQMGRLDEAADLYIAAAENHAKRMGEKSWQLPGAWASVGAVRVQQGRWADAEMAFRKSVDLSRNLLGLRKYDTWTRIARLVEVLHRQRKYGAETEALAREAMEGQQAHRFLSGGSDKTSHIAQSSSMFFERVIADSIFEQGRHDEAERSMRDLMARADGSEHLAAHRGPIRYRLADRLVQLGRAPEAAPLLAQAEQLIDRQKEPVIWRELREVKERYDAAAAPR